MEFEQIGMFDGEKEAPANALERRDALERLHRQMNEALLWEAVLAFEGYEFRTAKGLKFTYAIRGNEMFVDRKEKSITRASVMVAFHKALAGGVDGPKRLGCFGASYLYPVFLRFGLPMMLGYDGNDE